MVVVGRLCVRLLPLVVVVGRLVLLVVGCGWSVVCVLYVVVVGGGGGWCWLVVVGGRWWGVGGGGCWG